MNPRLAAARALAAVLSGKASLNSSLPAQLDKVEERDRGLTQDLAFGTARWQPRLDLLAAQLLQKPFKAPMPMCRRCCWSACTSCSTPAFRPTPPSARPSAAPTS
jgi:16S rRNA m(5)C-967 methyltransferase (EC 2.1.1.-)